MSLLVAAAGAAVVAGAALQSAVGFGFALVSAPLLFAALTPAEAVGVLVVLGLEINLLTLLGERRRPAPLWHDVIPVVAWSLPGSLAGVAILRSLDELALQLLVTAGVLTALVVNLRAGTQGQTPCPPGAAEGAQTRSTPSNTAEGTGGQAPCPRWWARPGAGLASGALNTSTSTGGPPLVLLLMGRGLSPAAVRDTLTACFIGFAPVSVFALVATGTEEAVPGAVAVAALVPLAAAGHVAGRPLFARLAAGDGYERVLTAVLLAAVATGLVSVLLGR